jgi:hypothetical protein
MSKQEEPLYIIGIDPVKKQTAVEWLVEQFEESHSYINEIFKETIEQAKAMHREQIIESNRDGVDMVVDKKPFVTGEQYYNEKYGGHIVNTNEMVDQVPDVRKMVEDDVAPIDWLINQLENHIVLSAHNKLGTNRTGDYRIGLRKAIDFCHQAKEMESKETLYTEEQVREAIDRARNYNDGWVAADDENLDKSHRPNAGEGVECGKSL